MSSKFDENEFNQMNQCTQVLQISLELENLHVQVSITSEHLWRMRPGDGNLDSPVSHSQR